MRQPQFLYYTNRVLDLMIKVDPTIRERLECYHLEYDLLLPKHWLRYS